MNYANGNIFEGLWVKGNKEGPGLFYYASTRKVNRLNISAIYVYNKHIQVYQGEWFEDQPRCGEFRVPNNEEALRLVRPLAKGVYHNDFDIPQIGLANPRSIVDMAVSDVRMNSVNKAFTRLSSPATEGDGGGANINPRNLDKAKIKFQELLGGDTESDTVSIYQSKPVFSELGLNLSGADIGAIISQLELQESLDISFAELVEIAVYIHGEKEQHAHSHQHPQHPHDFSDMF